MASKSIAGEYASSATVTVIESAANTLTFEKLEAGISIYDHVGWVLTRVEWRPRVAAYQQFNGSGDALQMALTMSNALAALSDSDPSTYAMKTIARLDLGTAASGAIFPTSLVDDFSGLPGGGLLVLPSPLYLGVAGSGLAAATTVTVKMYFKSIDMTQDDYFNLVQARQLLLN